VEIYTIGFTQKSAREFFTLLGQAGAGRLIDVRLNNRSQLAAFTKSADLEYFLEVISRAEYMHEPILSPTKEILDGYKKKELSWEQYETSFLALLAEREVQRTIDRQLFEVPTVLLCSEPTPEHCHRRLVAEYLAEAWGGARIVHL